MKFEIIELSPAEFEKCGNIWNMKQQENLAEQFTANSSQAAVSPMYTSFLSDFK